MNALSPRSAAAVISAALLLRSADARHPRRLTHSSQT